MRRSLQLWSLEDRCVPATFTVTSFDDLDPTGTDLTTGEIGGAGGPITLRSAILAANANGTDDTIIAPAGTYNLTITGANEDAGLTGDLDVSSNIAFQLTGAVIDGTTLGDRLLDIGDATVSITGGTFQNGTVSASGFSTAQGGGIHSTGSLTLTDVVVSGNRALGLTALTGSDTGFGASAQGGGVWATNQLVVNGGVIAGNAATGGNATPSLFAGGGSGGGLYFEGGSLQLTGTRLTGNVAAGGNGSGNNEGPVIGDGSGGGLYVLNASATLDIVRADNNLARGGDSADGDPSVAGNAFGGGINATDTTLSLSASTLDANTARGGSAQVQTATNLDGQGGSAYGGGLQFDGNGNLTVQNATLSGNTAQGGDGADGAFPAVRGQAFGGGLYFNPSGGPSGGSLLGNVTVTNNATAAGAGADAITADGGGLYQAGNTSVSLASSIVAGNRSPGNPDIGFNPSNGDFASGGSNLIGVDDGSGNFVNGTNNDQVGTAAAPLDPLLTPLGYFGGPATALVHALNIGSPARDGDFNKPFATDERGFIRPVGVEGDIGAFEVQIPSTLTLNPPATQVVQNQPFTVTGSVTDPRFQPTGTVQLLVNGLPDATGPLDAAGNFSITTTTSADGPVTLSFTYSGDAAYLSVPSGETTVFVQAASTTALTVSPNPAVEGQSVTLTATVTSSDGSIPVTGTVQFSVNGSPVGAPTAVDMTGTASVVVPPGLVAGTYPVVAAFTSGDSALADSSATGSLVVQAPTSTTLTVNPNPAFANQPLVLTSQVTTANGVPSGSVTFAIDGTPVGTTTLDRSGVATLVLPGGEPVGTYTVTASYAGTTIDLPSASPPATLSVIPSNTTTAVGVSPNPVFATDPVSFSATVAGATGGPTPTGTVTFFLDGNTVGTGTLDASGTATFTLTAGVDFGDGSYAVTAGYNGDANYTSSFSPATTLTVVPLPTTTTLTVTPPTATQGNAVTLTATVAFTATNPPGTAGVRPTVATGSVTFFNGLTQLGTAPLVNGVATLTTTALPVGASQLTAGYTPSTPNIAASQGTATATITAAPQSNEIFAVGSGYGIVGSLVQVYDSDGNLLRTLQPFGPDYWCGAVVATGDLTGDGIEDVAVTAPLGAAARVVVYDGATFNVIANFYAYDPSFGGGASLAVGDLTGDGVAELVTGAGPGGGPAVNVYSFVGGAMKLVNSFFAYEPTARSGVTVSVSGGLLATGTGFQGGPAVHVYSGPGLALVDSFFAFDPNSRNGVNVALSFDGTRTVLTAASGAGDAPMVKTFDATTGAQLTAGSLVYESTFVGGVTVTNVRTPAGESRTVFGTGLGGGPRVRILAADGTVVKDFFAFDPDFRGGVFVG